MVSGDSSVFRNGNAALNNKEFFEELFSIEAFRLGEFYLKTGQMTPIYIDLRRMISRPIILRHGAEKICEIIKARNVEYDYIVGVPHAAIPLATIVADILNKPMLLKRKDVKSYGTKQAIEGIYEKNKRVLLIEDVVTLGDSIRETAEGIKEQGLEVVDSIAILDRQQGGAANLKAANINFYSVLTMDNILDGLIEKGQLTPERKIAIVEHLRKPYSPSS